MHVTEERIWTLASRKFSGEATPAEIAELNKLVECASYGAYLKVLEEYWNQRPENDQDFLEATYLLHLDRVRIKGFNIHQEGGKKRFGNRNGSSSQKRRFAMQRWSIAFACCSILSLLFFIQYSSRENIYYNSATPLLEGAVSTKTGIRSNLLLPDGTPVWLNAESNIVFNRNVSLPAKREIEITGEAYLKVPENINSPLVIRVGKMHLEVRQKTTINVQAYNNEAATEVSVVEGMVAVNMNDRKEKIFLKSKDKLIVTHDSKVTSAQVTALRTFYFPTQQISIERLPASAMDTLTAETAWVDNKLVFNNESLEMVARKLQRWYGIAVQAGGQVLDRLNVKAVFYHHSVYQVLDFLRLQADLNYSIQDNLITITKRTI